MFGLTGREEEAVEDRREPPRPLSWHPSSTQFQVPSHTSAPNPLPNHAYTDWVPYQSGPSRNSGFESGYSSVSARGPAYQDHSQNLAAFPQPNDNGAFDGGSHTSVSSWQDIGQRVPVTSYAMSSYSTPQTEPAPWYLQNWTQIAQAQSAPSRPASPDFLPIQYPSMQQDASSQSGLDDDDDSMDVGKELVGMGLYDPPERVQPWQSSLLQGTGKGLKLEETWQPPEPDEDADDASSEDGSVDEPPARDEEQWSLKSERQLPANMEGQSFFFDDDETYTREWWFQQLKQPTVQDAGLGYGWL